MSIKVTRLAANRPHARNAVPEQTVIDSDLYNITLSEDGNVAVLNAITEDNPYPGQAGQYEYTIEIPAEDVAQLLFALSPEVIARAVEWLALERIPCGAYSGEGDPEHELPEYIMHLSLAIGNIATTKARRRYGSNR